MATSYDPNAGVRPGVIRSESSASGRRVRTRNRKPLSCESCRVKKLRCNRTLPACSNCLCRPEVGPCVYLCPKNRGECTQALSNASDQHPSNNAPVPDESEAMQIKAKDPSEGLQAQIDHLKKVIQQITTANDASNSVAAVPVVNAEPSPSREQTALIQSSPKGVAQSAVLPLSIGTPDSSSAATSEVGEALWVTLLGELIEKNVDFQRDRPPLPQTSMPTSLFASSRNVPQSQILLHLPSRYTCDQVLVTYFAFREPTSCLLHRSTFQEQYEAFWQQPGQTPIIWLALLLGILRIVVGAWVRDGNESPELRGKCSDLETLYRDRAAECLTHANYARPQEFLLEALSLHLYVEYSASRDFNSSVWVQHGLVFRLALRLGYHLDPDSLQHITPFQAEMRRRVWAYIRQADVLCSFQIGLPSVLRPQWLADKLPHNLDDTDFNQRSTRLPAPRPACEITSVSYLTAKTKLVLGLARALVAVSQDDNMTYERVLYFDSQLRGIYKDIPHQYQVHDLPEADAEDPLLTGLRLVLGAIYHKALCIIHSKFLKAATIDQRYLYSWLVCTESAMTIMKFQAFLYQLPRTSGEDARLFRYQHSLTTHDFFLAATIACTALFVSKGSSDSVVPFCASIGSSRGEMLMALEQSIAIFKEGLGESFEARRASERLSAIVSELRSDSIDLHQGEPINSASGRSSKDEVGVSQLSTAFDMSQRGTDVRGISQPSNAMETAGHDIPELTDWEPTAHGLDLNDPMSFVQDLQTQLDNYLYY